MGFYRYMSFILQNPKMVRESDNGLAVNTIIGPTREYIYKPRPVNWFDKLKFKRKIGKC